MLVLKLLADGHLPGVLGQSPSDMGDSEVNRGALYRSPGIYFTTEENSYTQMETLTSKLYR